MRLPNRKTVTKYAIAIAVGGLLAWMYLAIQKAEYGPFFQQPQADQLRMICDAFTIPGMMLTLSGLLMTVANEGALDGLTYLGHYMYHMFIPGKRSSTQRYGEYVMKKREKRVSGYGFLYVVGGISLAFALVFYALYEFKV